MIRILTGGALVWVGVNLITPDVAVLGAGLVVGGCILWASIGIPDYIERVADALREIAQAIREKK